jgi:ribosome-associated heat shock protein Hsp15
MTARKTSSVEHDDDRGDDERQRLDKFLVYARFVKTRALASELIKRGRVRLNGQRISKPDRQIGPGDVLTLVLPHATEVIRLLDLPEKRGSAQMTAELYERLSPEKDQK